MADAQITFEREDIEGIIPVGSYLGDALRRFGIKGFDRCSAEHDCEVTVTSGEEFLSTPTAVETEHFGGDSRKSGDRLACHARIERSGEIVIMTREKEQEPKPDEPKSEQYRKEFTELPLEQKISELMKLEAIALGDTFSFIINSPYKIFEKVGDVMADFGMKLENKAREAQRPEEHAKKSAENGKAADEQTENKAAQEQQ
jgi:ferredoxin